MKRLSTKSAVLLVIGLVLAAFGAVVAEGYYERMSAEDLMATLRDVELGRTSELETRNSLHKFERFGEVYPEGDKPSKITFNQYVFKNRGLALLHLSPAKFLWITVEYKNGLVYQKSFQYFEEPRCSGSVVESLTDANDSTNGRDFYLSGTEPSPTFRMKVTDSTAVPLARRKLDMEVNLSCMTRIGGCRDPRVVLKGAML